MRKWFVTLVSSAFVAMFAFVPQQAEAFCIDFDGFCDDIDLDFSGGLFYGYWDVFCDFGFGQGKLGGRGTTNVGLESSLGLAGTYVYDFPSRTFENFFWDGVSPPFFFLNGTFTLTPACDGPVAPIGDRTSP